MIFTIIMPSDVYLKNSIYDPHVVPDLIVLRYLYTISRLSMI